MNENKKISTIHLPSDLHKLLKVRAAQMDLKIGEALTIAVCDWIERTCMEDQKNAADEGHIPLNRVA